MGALSVWISGLLTLQMLLFVAGEQGEFLQAFPYVTVIWWQLSE